MGRCSPIIPEQVFWEQTGETDAPGRAQGAMFPGASQAAEEADHSLLGYYGRKQGRKRENPCAPQEDGVCPSA